VNPNEMKGEKRGKGKRGRRSLIFPSTINTRKVTREALPRRIHCHQRRRC